MVKSRARSMAKIKEAGETADHPSQNLKTELDLQGGGKHLGVLGKQM